MDVEAAHCPVGDRHAGDVSAVPLAAPAEVLTRTARRIDREVAKFPPDKAIGGDGGAGDRAGETGLAFARGDG